jgi:hypothetical protein
MSFDGAVVARWMPWFDARRRRDMRLGRSHRLTSMK